MTLEKPERDLKEEIWKEISTVVDPEIGLSLTELGLIYELHIDENNGASIKMTLTSMGCPIGPMLMEEVRNAAYRVDGVSFVNVDLVFSPPWDPREMASEEAREYLGIF